MKSVRLEVLTRVRASIDAGAVSFICIALDKVLRDTALDVEIDLAAEVFALQDEVEAAIHPYSTLEQWLCSVLDAEGHARLADPVRYLEDQPVDDRGWPRQMRLAWLDRLIENAESSLDSPQSVPAA